MNPITFKEKTRTLQKPPNMTDDECSPLDVYCDGKQCISLWKLSLRERFSALIYGKVWLYVLMGETQPPRSIRATRTVFSDEQEKSVGMSCVHVGVDASSRTVA